MRALFIGRFQPFHNGHLHVIKDILKDCESITIVIGGPEKADSKNPFTFSEREEMIRKVLQNSDLKNYEIHKIPDVNNDDEWNEKIRNLGDFDIAYSRNPWTIRCLKKIGIPVKEHEIYNREKYDGSKIRNLMASGKEWENIVPEKVVEFMKDIKGLERVKKLMG